MKKAFLSLLVMLMTCAAFAGYNDTKYDIALYDLDAVGSLGGKITSGALVFVYTASSKTLATLYSDTKRTSLTNPISRSQFGTDTAVKFFAAASSFDIVVALSDGSMGKWSAVSPSIHRLQVSRSGDQKLFVIPFGASDVTEVDTTIDLPKNFWVKDCFIEVVTVDATETIDVGLLSTETSGDADGLLSTVSVATSGFVKPYATTAGSNEKYVSTFSYGALMGAGVVGTDAASDFGLGFLAGHIVTGSNAVSVTYTGSAASDTAAGYIYISGRFLR
jgi:hypothetical protein